MLLLWWLFLEADTGAPTVFFTDVDLLLPFFGGGSSFFDYYFFKFTPELLAALGGALFVGMLAF